MKQLGVYIENKKIGKIFLTSESNIIHFEYDSDWIESKNAFSISQQLPLLKKEKGHIFREPANHFFSNLLPEGKIREHLAKRLGISETNDFQFLKAIGADCAGALQISPEPILTNKIEYKKISLEYIQELYENQPSLMVALQGLKNVRLSLAGAQDKITVRFKDGVIEIPKNGAPSTHLLKVPSRHYSHIIENEFLTNQIAIQVGLNAVNSKILKNKKFKVLLIERYDRFIDLKKIERLHQEDFCQALGISSLQKYQSEGGPNFANCFNLVQNVSANLPNDLLKLLHWFIFCVLIGNCDHHAKNLSLLMIKPEAWVLSPFYDLLCTQLYPNLSKNLAMSVGGSTDSGNLSKKHWAQLARDIYFSEKALLQMILEMHDRIESTLETEPKKHKREFSPSFLSSYQKTIRKQLKRIRLGLR